MEFRILGPLAVEDDGRALELGAVKQQSVLGALLLRPNEVVPITRLIDELWGNAPPATAPKLVQGYVSHLRKRLGEDAIVTRADGYLVEVPIERLDAARFRQLSSAGAACVSADPDHAARLLREALLLWHGTALEGLELYSSARHELETLAEQRLAALERRIEAELALGRDAELVGELRELVAEHPYREQLRGQLMFALYRCGRQAEALELYRNTSRMLADRLGLRPSEPLRELERRILRQDPALDLEARGSARPGIRYLPWRVGGRRDELAPRRRRRRMQLVALLAGVLAAATLISIFALERGDFGSDKRLSSPAGNSVRIVDPESGRLVGDVTLASAPADVAAGGGAIWVTNPNDGTVTRINPERRTIRQTIRVGGGPNSVAVGLGAVWVANGLDGTISRIDPQMNAVVQTITVGNGPSGIAIGDRAVWAVSRDDRLLLRIDPRSGMVLRAIEAGDAPFDVAVGAGAVWVTNDATGRVVKVDPATNKVVDGVNVGRGARAIAFGAGALWVANSLDGTVSRIDPYTDSVTRTIPVGSGAAGISVGRGSVWVSSEFTGKVLRVDPATGTVSQSIQIGGRPAGIAIAGTNLFAAVRPAGGAHRGGTITALIAHPLDGIDPATAFDSVTSEILGITYDGLTAFKRVGGSDGTQLVADLATSLPEPTNDGKDYTFRLRPGIRYSNGEPVRAQDFRRGLERLFQLHSPNRDFYLAIAGAKRCERRPRTCDLSGGIVADDQARAVSFHLTEPDPELPHKLALSAAVAVPHDTPSRDTAVRPLPATGAYMIASYVPDRQLRLVRNRHFREWSRAAKPAGYPDEIVFKLAAFHPDALKAVARGEADFVLAPTQELAKLRPQYASRLHANPRPSGLYLLLNTRLPPFGDARVRRALNYAVDRTLVVRAAGGPLTARSTCQVLPPSFPGYRRYCPYPHDLAKARRLVGASGTRGAPVVVWSPRSTESFTRPVVSALKALGYHTRLRIFEDNQWRDVFPRRLHQIQAIPFAWVADYPAAADMIEPLFSCRSRWEENPLRFCDAAVESAIEQALKLDATDTRTANDLWARVDRMIVDRAPAVPLFNMRRTEFVSARVANYQFNPQLGTLFDQLWVR
jgi:YVTN family beta-propeller protein